MKLTRSDNDKWLAGVAGGLADSLGIDSTIVRIVFAVLAVVSFGTGVVLYLVLWGILPRPTGGTVAQDGLKKAKEWNDDRKDRTGSVQTGENPDPNFDVDPDSDFKI